MECQITTFFVQEAHKQLSMVSPPRPNTKDMVSYQWFYQSHWAPHVHSMFIGLHKIFNKRELLFWLMSSVSCYAKKTDSTLMSVFWKYNLLNVEYVLFAVPSCLGKAEVLLSANDTGSLNLLLQTGCISFTECYFFPSAVQIFFIEMNCLRCANPMFILVFHKVTVCLWN